MLEKNKGFTLVELVIVMALSSLILGVILSLLLSVNTNLSEENNEYLMQLELASCKDFITDYVYESDFELDDIYYVEDGCITLGSNLFTCSYISSFSYVVDDNIYEFTIVCNDGYNYVFLLYDRIEG